MRSFVVILFVLAGAGAFHVVAPARSSTSSRSGRVAMGSTTDFKVGLTIEMENSVWRVQEFLHVKPGKGPAFVRTTLKNVMTGRTLDKTWRAGETFPDAQVDTRDMTYSYIDGDEHVFMDMETFEEARVKSAAIDAADFIKEEMAIQIKYWKGDPIDVMVPTSGSYKVVETSGAAAGSGKDKVMMPCTIETGVEIMVPDFIKEGDVIKVDTVERKYTGRDNS